MFRVQKVLLNEYQEIYEPVQVESPFTLVDTQGTGVRQYQIALTSSKLLFGCDNFYKQDEHCNYYGRGLDPEIECFDLISLVPLQYLRFHFYRKHDRCLMMLSVLPPTQCAQLKSEPPMIFEFGGHIHKQYFWYTWRERVATMHIFQPQFRHITAASPFSSSDVQLDEQQHQALVHASPPAARASSIYSVCLSSSSVGGA
ncbi:CG13558 [Drosophila busckii]|uniref:CG13558 n=1 Tax=Drosophila busckii TaxID=30019 RepID=A0A0M3QV35_DROBS|nr:uncharacterized protein LOC108595751 [Drosophila busckii]ALC41693.1 CG13558 [Drosophila busckii]